MECGKFAGIFKYDCFFTKVHATGKKDDIGVNFPNFLQIIVIEGACSYFFYDCAGAESCFTGSAGGHIIG